MTRSVARLLRLIIVVLAAWTPLPARAADPGVTPAPAGADAPADVPPDALDHYLTGRLLEERGLDLDAMEEYRQALALDPGRASIELRMSEIAARLGESRRALDYAAQVLEHEPGSARALWLQGSALFNLGEPRKALDALQAAVAADSGQLDYWRTLAHVAEQLDEVPRVADAWRHAVDLDEDDGESWFQLAAAEARLGHFEAADSLLAEATALNPVRPGALFLEGWIDENLGRGQEAVDLYRQHLEQHPGDQTARRRLVNLLVDAGRFAEAYENAQIVRAAQPDDPEALGVEADLALRLGHTAHGDQLLDEMEQTEPDDPMRAVRAAEVLVRRGRPRDAGMRAERWAAAHGSDYRGPVIESQVRLAAGDSLGAVSAARRAVAMAPDSLGPRFLLGGLLQSGRHYAAAESVWAGVLAHDPTVTRAELELAFCREQLGALDGATSAIRDVLAREPQNASALNFLGYLFADHDRNLEEAEDLVRRALALEPDNGAFVDSMGWVYYRMGRLAEARKELERAAELTHGDPVVREHLGDVYKDLKLFELAREQYRQAASRDKDNPRLRAKLSEIR